MRKLLLLTLLSLPLLAQTVTQPLPDCQLLLGNITTAAPTNTAPFDNRNKGCTFWTLTYNSTGFSALSILVQTAPNVNGVPGAWSTFVAASGSNPNTNTAEASATFGSVSGGTTSYFPWIRVQLTSKTGTGIVTGNLYGWKVPAGAASSSGCVGTAAVPCVVDGPNAEGTAATFPPVLQAGQDGAPGVVRVILTDSAGRQIVVGPTANGVIPSTNPVLIAGRDSGPLTRIMLTDTLGRPVIVGAGIPGTPSGGTVSIQGNVGGVAVAVGQKTNNAAVPGNDNVGALICLANAAVPTWTEGNLVTCSSDLSGNTRVTGSVPSGTALASSGGILPVGISDGSSIFRLRGDLNGRLILAGSTQTQSDGISNTSLPIIALGTGGQDTFLPTVRYTLNSTVWDRDFVCGNQAAFNLSGSGSTQIIAASGSTIVRICHIDFLTTAAVNVKIVQGTGANCVTSPSDITGLYTGAGAFSFAMDYAPTSALRAPASAAVCVNQSGAVTTGGTVIYAQF